MQIHRRQVLRASCPTVWAVLAQGFDTIDRWASGVSRAIPIWHDGDPPPGLEAAPIAGRSCTTALGGLRELLVQFDPKAFRLAYDITPETLPFFVKGMHASWSLTSTAAGTELDVVLTVEILPGFQLLPALPLRRQVSTYLADLCCDLEHLLDMGAPHPRKQGPLGAVP